MEILLHFIWILIWLFEVTICTQEESTMNPPVAINWVDVIIVASAARVHKLSRGPPFFSRIIFRTWENWGIPQNTHHKKRR